MDMLTEMMMVRRLRVAAGFILAVFAVVPLSAGISSAKPVQRESEVVIRNAHGEFVFTKPSAREQENAGVGVHVGAKSGELTVQGVGEDSPAEKAGIRADDVIVSVDGKAMKGVGLEQAVGALRGKAGTLVVLVVRSKGTTGGGRKVPLIRQNTLFKTRGEPQPAVSVRDFEAPEKDEKCAAEKEGCLYLLKEQGRCYYSCKTQAAEPAKKN